MIQHRNLKTGDLFWLNQRVEFTNDTDFTLYLYLEGSKAGISDWFIVLEDISLPRWDWVWASVLCKYGVGFIQIDDLFFCIR